MCPAPVDPLQLEIPRGAMRDYIELSKASAVVVLTLPAGHPCDIRVGGALSSMQKKAKQRWHFAVEITVALWVLDRAQAVRVCQRTCALARQRYRLDKHRHWHMDGREARALIEEAATSLAIRTTDHGAYMQMVRQRCALIEDDMQRAQAKGQLHWFNRAYHRYRITDPDAVSFYEARLRLRRAIMRRVVAGYGSAVNADLLGEIFPRLYPCRAANDGTTLTKPRMLWPARAK